MKMELINLGEQRLLSKVLFCDEVQWDEERSMHFRASGGRIMI